MASSSASSAPQPAFNASPVGAAATPAELQSLSTDGFFIRRDMFDAQTMAAIETLGDAAVDLHNAEVDDSSISKKNRITFVNSGGDRSPSAAGLLQFSLQPRVAALARSVAGPDAAHFAYQLVYKHPHNPDVFPWHQDDSYTASDRGYFTLWLAISDATIPNGCLRVLTGESLDRLRDFEMTPLGRTCWPLDHPNQGTPVELKRGDAVIFTSKMIHSSGANTTDHFRKALIVAFIDQKATSTRTGEPYKTLPYPDSKHPG